MNDLPILSAAQSRVLTVDGVAYRLRSLTYGEASAMDVVRAARGAPSIEQINEALREAATAANRADLAEAITASEEAEIEVSAWFQSRPSSLDAEGLARWEAENAPELRRLQAAVIRAGRRRAQAIEMFGAAPRVAELRARSAAVLHGAALDMVAAALTHIGDTAVTYRADDVAALPSAHVVALAQAVQAMLTPSLDAAKN